MVDDKKDRETFREAFKNVRRITDDRVDLRPAAPKPIPRQRYLDERALRAEIAAAEPASGELEYGDELHYQRPGLQHGVVRKLRRGQFAIQDEVDLHGLNAKQAKTHLDDFLRGCRRRGLRCVRVVHGKGLGSSGKLPVLKPRVAFWLARRDDVLAYTSARRVDGGTGALYVLLRSKR